MEEEKAEEMRDSNNIYRRRKQEEKEPKDEYEEEMKDKSRKSVQEEERGREDTTNKFALPAECGTYNQSTGVTQPFKMNKIGEGVLEARFHLLPPSDNKVWKTEIHLMYQEENQTLARVEIDHILGRYDQVNLKCSSISEDDHSLKTNISGLDANISLTPQDFFQLRVACYSVHYNSRLGFAYPLSFKSFDGEKRPRYLQTLVSVFPYINTLSQIYHKPLPDKYNEEGKDNHWPVLYQES